MKAKFRPALVSRAYARLIYAKAMPELLAGRLTERHYDDEAVGSQLLERTGFLLHYMSRYAALASSPVLDHRARIIKMASLDTLCP